MHKHSLFATLAGLCVIGLTACHDDKSANTVPPTTAENSATMPSQQPMNPNNPSSTDTTTTTTTTTSPSMATGDSSTQQPAPTIAPDVVPGGDAGSSMPLTPPPASAAPAPSSMPDPSIQPQPSSMPDPSIQPQPSSMPDSSVQPQPSSMPAPAMSGSSGQPQPAR